MSSCDGPSACCALPGRGTGSCRKDSSSVFDIFGQGVRDLLIKKYDYSRSFKTVIKPSRPFTVETLVDGSRLQGSVLASYVDNNCGSANVELQSNPMLPSRATLSLRNLCKSKNFALTFGAKQSSCKNEASGELEYNCNTVSAQLKATSDLASYCPKLNLSAVYRLPKATVGFTAGASCASSACCPTSSSSPSPSSSSSCATSCGPCNLSLDFGLQAPKDGSVYSLYTSKNHKFLNVGYLSKLNEDTSFGALFRLPCPLTAFISSCCDTANACSTGPSDRVVKLGVDHKLNNNTTLQLKTELPSGVVSGVWSYSIPRGSSSLLSRNNMNQAVSLSVAAQIDTKKVNQSGLAALDKIGFALQAGDF